MIVDPTPLLNDDLRTLRSLFQEAGFDIRLVGGCVRDLMSGKTPKDIDLCTDANPQEQIAIYQENNIRYIETGLQHGTISIVMNDVIYEITSLRIDVETDGRHAVVKYTKDGVLDSNLLQKFEELGYEKDKDYDIDELTKVFQQIIRLS